MNLPAPVICVALLGLAITGCTPGDQDGCQWSGPELGTCADLSSSPAANAIITGMQRRQQEEQQQPREQLTYQPNPYRI